MCHFYKKKSINSLYLGQSAYIFQVKKKRSRKLGAHVMLDIMRDIKDTNDFKHTKAIQNNPISQTKIC